MASISVDGPTRLVMVLWWLVISGDQWLVTMLLDLMISSTTSSCSWFYFNLYFHRYAWRFISLDLVLFSCALMGRCDCGCNCVVVGLTSCSLTLALRAHAVPQFSFAVMASEQLRVVVEL